MSKKTLIFIGYGSMAKAIACGINNSELKNKYDLEITGRNLDKAEKFIKENKLEGIAKAVPSSPHVNIKDKILILCVKPYALKNFSYEGKAKSVYSVMAGVNISAIKNHVSSSAYAKVMPNVGAKFQKSSNALFIEGDIKEEANELLSSFGNAVFVDSENLVDASIATGGSSIAFLGLIAQSLIDAGVREGLRRDDSIELVRATFEGFSHLLAHQSPDEIISSITSPGGTTIEGLAVLENRAVRGAIIEACHQAVAKARG